MTLKLLFATPKGLFKVQRAGIRHKLANLTVIHICLDCNCTLALYAFEFV